MAFLSNQKDYPTLGHRKKINCQVSRVLDSTKFRSVYPVLVLAILRNLSILFEARAWENLHYFKPIFFIILYL